MPPLAGRSDLRCFEYAYLKRPTWVLGSGWVFPVGLRAASKLTVTEMTLSEIEDIAVLAERACAAATNYPNDKELREHLYDSVRPVVDFGSEDDTTYSADFIYLLRQTAVWADIVRCRIENSRTPTMSTTVESVQYATRDLHKLLARLVSELQQSSAGIPRSSSLRKLATNVAADSDED